VEGADMIEWERVLRTDLGQFDANYGLGSKMYELNYHDDARPLLERARRNDKGALQKRKRVRMMLARIIETQSSLIDSEVMLREGLALPPEPDIDPRLQFLLSRCLASMGKRAEAKNELSKLIAAYPNHAVTATARKSLEALK
jgi:tetratricopeptide (TPR) repeat protein